MKWKISLALLFTLVTGAFLYGFISYRSDLKEDLAKEIIGSPGILVPREEDQDEEDPVLPEPEPLEVELPSLIDLPRIEAEERLLQLKLVPNIVEKKNTGYEKDVVFWQEPYIQMQILEGETVTLYVSNPTLDEVEETISVPLLIGLTEEEASTLLFDLGFHVDYEYNPNADYEKGVVYSQNYFVDATVSIGTRVTIRVSEGRGE